MTDLFVTTLKAELEEQPLFATHCPDGQKCGAETTGCRVGQCQRAEARIAGRQLERDRDRNMAVVYSQRSDPSSFDADKDSGVEESPDEGPYCICDNDPVEDEEASNVCSACGKLLS